MHAYASAVDAPYCVRAGNIWQISQMGAMESCHVLFYNALNPSAFEPLSHRSTYWSTDLSMGEGQGRGPTEKQKHPRPLHSAIALIN